MKKFTLAAIATAIVASGSAIAATDGTLGVDSTGTSVVTIIKDNAVQISNVNDLTFGSHSVLAGGGVDNVLSDDVCVFSSTGGYNVTVTNVETNFELSNGTDAIGYTLTWDGTSVSDGVAITGLTGDSTSLNCSSGTNATFEVTLDAADFNSGSPGSYTDTLTLFIQPE